MNIGLLRRNSYVLLRLRILWNIFRKRKLSCGKIFNALRCMLTHQLQSPSSGTLPVVMTFELINECNARCGVCRTPEGAIIDRNPHGAGYTFQTGSMPFEMYTAIIDQVQRQLVIAVLYVNGEPLLYEPLFRAIRYATERRVATMISTNGFLLSEERSRQLLDSGLDFIKIAISGFSPETARIQHRAGDIERVKKEVRTLARFNRERGERLIIMMDYISYRYNDHELEEARRYCEELGIIFNIRPGIHMGVEDIEPPPPPIPEGFDPGLCDWPWKILAVNWNGDLMACCDHLMWSGAPVYTRFIPGETQIETVWNSPNVCAFRKMLVTNGRRAIPACAECCRKGTTFTL